MGKAVGGRVPEFEGVFMAGGSVAKDLQSMPRIAESDSSFSLPAENREPCLAAGKSRDNQTEHP